MQQGPPETGRRGISAEEATPATRSRGGERGAGSVTGATAGASCAGSHARTTNGTTPPVPNRRPLPKSPKCPSQIAQEETKDKFEGDRHVPARGRRPSETERSGQDRSRRERRGTTGRGTRERPAIELRQFRRRRLTRSEERRSDDGPGEFEEEPLLVGGGVEESAGEEDGEDDDGEQAVSYEDVPTWEEAISYLLHPSQVQVEPGPAMVLLRPRQAPGRSASSNPSHGWPEAEALKRDVWTSPIRRASRPDSLVEIRRGPDTGRVLARRRAVENRRRTRRRPR